MDIMPDHELRRGDVFVGYSGSEYILFCVEPDQYGNHICWSVNEERWCLMTPKTLKFVSRGEWTHRRSER